MLTKEVYSVADKPLPKDGIHLVWVSVRGWIPIERYAGIIATECRLVAEAQITHWLVKDLPANEQKSA